MSELPLPLREIATNRRARHDFDILDTLECGISLVGTEVKTLREGKITLSGSFVGIVDHSFFLYGANIPEYGQGNIHNHEPSRTRRLLAHKKECQKWEQKCKEKGLTIIPLKIYFQGKKVKILIGVARGRKHHDKREHLKKKDADRQIRRHIR
jgi:SsrA-binding protein